MKCMQACFTAAASCQNQLILKLLLPLLLLAVFPYSCFFFFLRSFFCAFVHGSQHYIYVYVFHLRSVVADLATTLAGGGMGKTRRSVIFVWMEKEEEGNNSPDQLNSYTVPKLLLLLPLLHLFWHSGSQVLLFWC